MKRKILCLCLMIVLSLSICMTGSAKSFDDTDGHWAESSIEKWSEYEVINGKPQNKFDPNGFMTRAEASAVFSRLLVLEKRDNIEKFKDVDFNAWYTESLEKCVAAGILNGDGNNMNPDGYITREMFFVMIARALSIPTEEFSTTNFDDEKDVSLWSKPYVNALVNKKYVNGIEGSRIAPKENITRASVITLLDRIVKNYVIENGTYISNTENGIALVLADNCKVHSGFEGTVVVAKADITIDLTGANNADIIIKSDNITVKNAPSSTTVVVDSDVENVEVNGNKVDSGISFTVKSLETEKETKPAVSPSRPHSHNYIPTVTKNPTCTEDGVKTFKCSCGKSYTEPIEKLSENDTHTPKSAVKENETEGNCETKVTYDEVVYCSVCDEELSRTEKTGDFGDHSPKAAVKENETEGDCKTKITYDEVVYCSICNDELSRTQKEGNFGAHSPKSAVKENETTGNCKTKATYDEVVYCSICDDELSRTQKSGNYGEHSPKSAVKENEKVGNCKTNATYDEVVYCSICNDELSRTEKTGELGDHSPKTAVKENETEGDCKTKITYDEVVYCSICNDELSRTQKEGNFGAHSPKSAVKENETAGNCKTNSTYDEVVYCAICNDELSRTEKTGEFGDHFPKVAVKENETEGNCKTKATYDEVVYCSICNDELSRTEKTGSFGKHNFNGVECTICHIEDPNATYTVVFKDYDGRELKTQSGIVKGGSATAPADPTREGFSFIGWDVSFSNVTGNLVVTAQYEEILGAYLSSSNQVVDKNAILIIPVKLLNCSTPIKTMGISISNVPEGISIKKGSWSSDFEYELQNFNKTRLQGASTLVEQGIVNGDIFKFEFTVSDTVEAGTYTIEIEMILKYFDANEDEVSLPCQSVKVQVTIN